MQNCKIILEVEILIFSSAIFGTFLECMESPETVKLQFLKLKFLRTINIYLQLKVYNFVNIKNP